MRLGRYWLRLAAPFALIVAGVVLISSAQGKKGEGKEGKATAIREPEPAAADPAAGAGPSGARPRRPS